MSLHTHPDLDRLTWGCPGCIARAEQARWDNAPLRHVTWHCTYAAGGTHLRRLTFTLAVRVPDGADPIDIDDRYADRTGEAFVLALPDDVPIDDTDEAAETMHVERVVVGELVDKPAPMHQESLL